ncbi:hypothetical protein KUH03_36510 [Sphingobacterium sp. E70]|uniref:hypothetical protein n=1 Tax=Sphingobacterium sp. E70 TaxID=2853439 RepID=UPI00211C9FE7|nr:hypothetical protein [Sphingobacterium sp. E70]ULT24434.1 hypothetical protein KUH03_36510 [Sphingobacterium sp. E70]
MLFAGVHAIAQKKFDPYEQTIEGTNLSFKMVAIPGGSFKMGSVTGGRMMKSQYMRLNSIRSGWGSMK